MTIAYACILVAALLPYVWAVFAKTSGSGNYDNRDPRAWLANQDSARSRRANAAQLNGFEAFPAFAAAVLMAELAGVDVQRITLLALGFVGFRILHGLFYVLGNASARSIVWFGGFACVLALMVSAILRIN
ncbi:MAG: MAPEG family protein [Pseudoxanthomonas suwonensis]|nr:MAPEG family protein [Pseudoxanthomonas suwonensis]